MSAQTQVTAVTRYTDYDAEFTFLGVFSGAQKAHQEISKNIELYGKFSYRKEVGDWNYTLHVNNDVVELRTPKGKALVRYKLTQAVIDQLKPVSEF